MEWTVWETGVTDFWDVFSFFDMDWNLCWTTSLGGGMYGPRGCCGGGSACGPKTG